MQSVHIVARQGDVRTHDGFDDGRTAPAFLFFNRLPFCARPLKRNAFQFATMAERIAFNRGHAVGNGNAIEGATTKERRVSNHGHVVGNDDACKSATIAERIA